MAGTTSADCCTYSSEGVTCYKHTVLSQQLRLGSSLTGGPEIAEQARGAWEVRESTQGSELRCRSILG